MIDEVTLRRQFNCAHSPEGHDFGDDMEYGVCLKCKLIVDPPEDENG